jgi:hypothetical protein
VIPPPPIYLVTVVHVDLYLVPLDHHRHHQCVGRASDVWSVVQLYHMLLTAPRLSHLVHSEDHSPPGGNKSIRKAYYAHVTKAEVK